VLLDDPVQPADVSATLVARSLIDGKAYAAILSGHIVTALVRAQDGGEAYLAIAAEGFIQPRMIALELAETADEDL
jgi:hypothetical protein